MIRRGKIFFSLLQIIFLGGTLINALMSVYRIISTSAPDFGVFYYSSRHLMAGLALYRNTGLYTALGYPPFTPIFFIPISLIPYQFAQGIWILGSVSAIPISVKLIDACFKLKLSWQKIAIISAFSFYLFPVKFTLGMGQVNLVALVLLLGSVLMSERTKPVQSGIIFGLLLVLKPHFLILVPVLMFYRKWPELFWAGGTVIFFAALAGFIGGWWQYVSYVNDMVKPLSAFAGREIYYNQGLGAFLSRILPNLIASRLTLILSMILYIGTLIYIHKNSVQFAVGLALFLSVFLFIEPLSWQHHYVFLMPLLILLGFKRRSEIKLYALLTIGAVLIGLNIKHPEFISGNILSPGILSHVFLGNILIFGLSLSKLNQVKFRKS